MKSKKNVTLTLYFALGLIFLTAHLQAATLITKLNSPAPVNYGYFGCPSAMSKDGNVIVASNVGESNYSGAVYIFTKNNNTYSLCQKITPPDAGSGYTQCKFGYSLAISDDANTIAISEPARTATITKGANILTVNFGRIYIYHNTYDKWHLIKTLKQNPITSRSFSSYYGYTLSFGSSGTTLAVGGANYLSPYHLQHMGTLYIYSQNQGGTE